MTKKEKDDIIEVIDNFPCINCRYCINRNTLNCIYEDMNKCYMEKLADKLDRELEVTE